MNGEDLRKRLEEVRASQRELAAFMEVDPRVVHRIITGRRKKISTAEADAISRFFAMRRTVSLSVTLKPAILSATATLGPLPERTEVPLFGGVETTDGWRLSLASNAKIGSVAPHPAQANSKRAFAVKIVEDIMSPRFEVGEIAYAVTGRSLAVGQDCLVELPDQTARVLQFVTSMNAHLVFSQLNPKQTVDVFGIGAMLHAIVGRG